MGPLFRKSLCFILALILIPTQFGVAQQTGTSAPLPPQITSAKTIFISNAGGSDLFNAFTEGPNRAYSHVYAALQQWHHYQIVSSPSEADLIFEIRAEAPSTEVTDTNGVSSPVFSPQLRLRILEAKTNALLWTLTSNIRAVGRQKTRDKDFDKAVVILVNQVRQLTGEQLSPTELKAIRSSTRMSTATKVFIGAAVAGSVAILVLLIYHATHQNPSKLPTIPTCTTPPFCPVT
jgi:hypothetical protein